jgi:CubicO group peptidase (beta-lactamase class C family)
MKVVAPEVHALRRKTVRAIFLRRSVALLSVALHGCWPVPSSISAQEWRQYKDYESAGWSTDKLDEAKAFANQCGSAAVLIVDHGRVVAAWGHVQHTFKSASISKSLYDATIGAEHLAKPIDVGATLEHLGIDDLDPLSADEKTATLEQLMSARSGVYHPAAYETDSNARRRPDRGSAKPGERWYYNNWDFNVLCAMFEKLTGSAIGRAFEARIVRPLGFEDFHESCLFDWLEPRRSQYPATTIRISARDLARVGKLYLQQGLWEGKRILSSEWIAQSTRPATVFPRGHERGEGNGYGRLWWIFPPRPERPSAYDAELRIVASGAGGQRMVLVPKLQVIVVHLADTDAGRGVDDSQVNQLLEKIFAARENGPIGQSSLKSLAAESLDVAPPAALSVLDPIHADARRNLQGRYMISDQQGLRFYEFKERMFVEAIGFPLPDVELFLSSDGLLRNPLVNAAFSPQGGLVNPPQAIGFDFQGRELTAQRIEGD